MRMTVKQFFNIVSGHFYRCALPPVQAASLQLQPNRAGGTVHVQGRADAQLVRLLNEAKASIGLEVDAAVLSYATPIGYRAWFNAHNHAGKRLVWIVPKQKHSVTTSRHQNQLRAALGQRLPGVPYQLNDIAALADIYE